MSDDQDKCRTPDCDEDPNNGEGWDGYCGNCADRLPDGERIFNDKGVVVEDYSEDKL